jgi:hypothetical protein
MHGQTSADPGGESWYLNCPRCGLTVTPRARWLAIRYCPRCVARSQTIVEMFSSRLPAEALYPNRAVPHAEDERRTLPPRVR